MTLLEQKKLELTNSFVNSIKTLEKFGETVNQLELLSQSLHERGFANSPHIYIADYANGHNPASFWITLYVHREETVIGMLQFLQQLGYLPDVNATERDQVEHGYRIGDIGLSLEFSKFNKEMLESCWNTVFAAKDEQADTGNAPIPSFLLKDNEAKAESQVQA